jgi:cation transport ATPase
MYYGSRTRQKKFNFSLYIVNFENLKQNRIFEEVVSRKKRERERERERKREREKEKEKERKKEKEKERKKEKEKERKKEKDKEREKMKKNLFCGVPMNSFNVLCVSTQHTNTLKFLISSH